MEFYCLLAGLQVPENTAQPGHEANESGTTCVTLMGVPTIQHKRPVGRKEGRKEREIKRTRRG